MDNENPITDAIDETEAQQDGGEAGNEDRQEQAETEGGAAESAEEPGDGNRGQKQTHELNAAAKAARKQAERETEERMRRKFDEEIAATGIPNPYTGKPFGSWKEFQDYSKRFHDEQIRQRAQDEQRTEEDIRREDEDKRLAAQKRAELQEQADAKKREDERRTFIMADAKAFMEKFPKVDLQKLDENKKFRRFCGKRYGVEPLADLYQFGSRAELSLGVSHATSSKKNLLLMTGSFALSILLFLSFSVLLRWVGFALNPLQPYTPDLSMAETSGQNVLDPVLVEQLETLPEVKHAFGRMYCPLPAEYQGKQGSIDLISYDTIQFGWAKKDLIGGTLPQEPEDGTYPVLTVFDKSNSLTVGDTIQLEDAKLTVVGVLNDSPFSSTDSPIVICTEETFHQLTGQNRYAVIDIQLKDTTADAAIAQIHTLLSDTLNKQVVFSNRIEGNRMIQSTYWAFHLVVYAFLIVIAGITILNIVNSISMSVSARMKQYGILRAIGMDDAQLKRMISAEAGTYAVSGLVVGIALGLVLNRKLYILLITHYFGATWQMPWGCLAVIVVVVLAAVVLAVYNPVRRILMQPITATISEL